MDNLEILISKDKFDLDFSGFKGTTKTEYDILDKCFLSIKESEAGHVIKFKLIQVSKKIQPLDIIASLKNDSTIGQLTLNVKDEEDNNVGKIKFKNVKFVEIKDLIDFDFEKVSDNKEPFINVIIKHDGISYETKSGKEETI